VRIHASEASGTASSALWDMLADLPAWPRWCPTVTVLQPDGPLRVGTTARVVQPGLRPAVWTIDDVVPGRSFRWSSRGPGFVVTEDHLLLPRGPGTGIEVRLQITGLMAWAVALIAGRALRDSLPRWARALAAQPHPTA